MFTEYDSNSRTCLLYNMKNKYSIKKKEEKKIPLIMPYIYLLISSLMKMAKIHIYSSLVIDFFNSSFNYFGIIPDSFIDISVDHLKWDSMYIIIMNMFYQ